MKKNKLMQFTMQDKAFEIMSGIPRGSKGFFVNKAIEFFAQKEEAKVLFGLIGIEEKTTGNIKVEDKKITKKEEVEKSIPNKNNLQEW